MATVTRDQTSKSFNGRMQLPNTRCALQCMKEEYKESGKGNMMIAREWQVIEHAPVKIDGVEVDISGCDIPEYMVLKKSDGKGGFLATHSSEVKKALGQAYNKLDAFGFPSDYALDIDNPELIMLGKVIDGMVNSQGQQMNHPPTTEDLAAGRKIGAPKVDEDGKPELYFKLNIMYFLGVSKTEPKSF